MRGIGVHVTFWVQVLSTAGPYVHFTEGRKGRKAVRQVASSSTGRKWQKDGVYQTVSIIPSAEESRSVNEGKSLPGVRESGKKIIKKHHNKNHASLG